MAATPIQGEGIRLAYTKSNTGAVSFKLPSGKIVRGANSPAHRFVWVETEEDANHLVQTGSFRRAPESGETEEVQPVTLSPLVTGVIPSPPAMLLAEAANQSTDDVDELSLKFAQLAEEPAVEVEPEPKRRNRKSEE